MIKSIFSMTILGGLILLYTFGMLACTSDELPEPVPLCDPAADPVTYNNQIKPIIDTYCTIPSCHVSNHATDYTSYEKIENILHDDNGGFKYRTIDIRSDPTLGMPPDYASNPGPKDFTDEDFETIKCWIEQGYPE